MNSFESAFAGEVMKRVLVMRQKALEDLAHPKMPMEATYLGRGYYKALVDIEEVCKEVHNLLVNPETVNPKRGAVS
jgi:hypothetical protein